jgi:predicted nucleic acid-binding protein
VLLDVLGADPTFGPRSREALRQAYDAGALVACEIVWAEVRAHFATEQAFRGAMRELGVQFDPLTADAAEAAGRVWRHRRGAGQPGRDRVVADFLIAAHALLQADALVTRDRGFYRRYFANLKLVDPSV